MSVQRPEDNAPAGSSTAIDAARNLLVDRYSERLYQRYPDILAAINAEGIIQRLNPAFEELTGHTADTAQDFPLADWLHPDDRTAFAECQAQLQSDYDRFNLVARLRSRIRKDGWMWINWSGFPGPEPGTLFLVGRDVTEQKAAELSLLARQKQLHQTIELAGLPTWELDLGSLDFVFNDAMLALLGTSATAEGGYRMPFTRFMDRHSDRANSSNLVQRVVRFARSNQTDFNERFAYHLRTPSGESFEAEFLLRGILDDNHYLLRAFGTVQAVKPSVSAGHAADGSIAVWDRLPNAVLHATDEGYVQNLNPAAAKLFAYSGSDLPLPLAQLVPEQYREVLTKQLALLRKEPDKRTFEGRWIDLHGLRSDGHTFPVSVAISGGPAPQPYILLVRDRSESELQQRMLNRLQQEVQVLHGRPRQVLEAAPVPLLLTDGQMLFDANSAALLLFRMDLLTAQNRPLGSLLQVDAASLDNLHNLVDQGNATVAASVLQADASAAPVELRVARYLPQDNRMLLIAILPVQARNAHAQQAAFTGLTEAMAVARIGTWQLDTANGDFTVDDRHMTWMGVDLASMPGHTLAWDTYLRDHVHPEDVSNLKGAVQALLHQEANDHTGQVDYRLISTGGRFRYLTMRLQSRPEAQQQVLFGTCQDVTEIRLQEIERLERQRRMEAQDKAVLELTSAGIFGQDLPLALRRIAATVCEVLDIDRCGMWTYAPDHSAMQCIAMVDRTNPNVGEALELREAEFPNYFQAVRANRVLPVKYVTIDPRTSEFSASYLAPNGIGSMMDVGVLRAGELVGMLCCEHRGFPRDWYPDEQRFVISMSELVALVLETADRLELLNTLAAKEAELTRANHELRLLNDALHQSVADRTQAYDQLKQAHQYLVQQGKLASLGQLLAGVAHEINTPVAAILSSVRNLEEQLLRAMQDVPTLLRDLPEPIVALVMQLVHQAPANALDDGTQQERVQRAALQQQLEQHGLPHAFELARDLNEFDVNGNLPAYLPLLQLPNASQVLGYAVRLLRLRQGLTNITTAGNNAVKVVRALRSLSQDQPDNAVRQPVLLSEQIDTVLTVFHNQLKHNFLLDKYYQPDTTPVPVYAEELSQVWTHMITNAVQAMDGRGRLTVEHWIEGEWAYVRITDNGPGIPPDVLPRIFEPFYTTKPAAGNSGLGLDICQKIVTKHGGSIEVKSHPGQTSFTVLLPLVAPPEPNDSQT